MRGNRFDVASNSHHGDNGAPEEKRASGREKGDVPARNMLFVGPLAATKFF